MLLVDYDRKLLSKFYPLTKKHLLNYDSTIIKNSALRYSICGTNEIKDRLIKMKNIDLTDALKNINNFDIISLSAMLDILSKKFIKRLFDQISSDKVIYLSLCFDGKISWKRATIYDKYITSKFNNHQLSKKSLGDSLGSLGIKTIKNLALKKGFEIKISDSSWNIDARDQDHKNFQIMYLKTIYKALNKDSFTDNNILKEWYEQRLININIGKENIKVGHQDILILT